MLIYSLSAYLISNNKVADLRGQRYGSFFNWANLFCNVNSYV